MGCWAVIRLPVRRTSYRDCGTYVSHRGSSEQPRRPKDGTLSTRERVARLDSGRVMRGVAQGPGDRREGSMRLPGASDSGGDSRSGLPGQKAKKGHREGAGPGKALT